ncbi:WYL domain-containing protein [Myxococcota bacterium]|nr:WYL domain-containing protein [Myxococcota bacterium]
MTDRVRTLKKKPKRARTVRATKRVLEGVVELHRQLDGGGVKSLSTLAGTLGASGRTVQRYIEVIRERFGVEVVFDRERGGYRYSNAGLPIPAARLSEDDLVALFLAAPMVARHRGTPLGPRFEAALRKLTASLPERARERIAPLAEHVHVRGTAPVDVLAVFQTVLEAIVDERQLALNYLSASRGTLSDRVVDPYALTVVDDAWYVLAFCHARARVLPFHLRRIWACAPLKTTFVRPEGFDPEAHLGDALGIFTPPDPATKAEKIVVRLDAFAAQWAREHQLHPSQVLKGTTRGTVELTLSLAATEEVERFVLGWGEHAEVLAPEALRAKVQARLRAALARYA